MSIYDSIVITGGNGMLAHALRQSLADRSIPAIMLDRAQLDVTNFSRIADLFDEHRPTLVLNCAAYTKVDQCEKDFDAAFSVNGHAPGYLARLSSEAGARFVHYSTDYVFDGTLTRPLRPNDPVGPKSSYGKTKLHGEQLIHEVSPTNSLIIRTAWLYGPNGPNFVQTMVNAARAGKPLKVVDDQVGSPTFTHDLASATLDLLDHGATGIWHLANSGQTNWHDFTAAILEEFNLKTELTRTTSAEWKKLKPDSAPRPAYSVLDTMPYEKLTGKPMPHWRDALHRYRLSGG